MRHRALSSSSDGVSVVGLGCMALSGAYGPVSEREGERVLGKALDLGINHFDTADVYGGGSNERLLGRFLKQHRAQVVVATKGGATRTANNEVSNDGTPEHLRRACDASLQRLGVDCIDLYYLHRVDPLVPIEESIGALGQLVAAGKIRAIGLSEVAPETLRRAHRTHPIAALQTEYSLSCREAEAEILPLCQELGVLFVAYSPLGRGLWGGVIQAGAIFDKGDIRSGIPRFLPGNLEDNLKLVGDLNQIALAHRISLPQLALAWVLSRGEHVVAIPGTRDEARLIENAAAAKLVLPPDVIRAIDRFPAASVKGLRHSPKMLARTNL